MTTSSNTTTITTSTSNNPLYYGWGWLRSHIYNRFILSMTTGWYQVVLEDLPPQSKLLDVGIGTAGALLACQKLVEEKQLQIIGIDYDEQYVQQAQKAIQEKDASNSIQVLSMSVYDVEENWKELVSQVSPNILTNFRDRDLLDAVYFSGSFSLLPHWEDALLQVSKLLKRQGGKIYITQTYQKETTVFPWQQWLLGWIKPMLKYLTTIDFGPLVMAKDMELFYQQFATQHSSQGWKLIKHEIIPNSVNNPWQAAYLTVFQVDDNDGTHETQEYSSRG